MDDYGSLLVTTRPVVCLACGQLSIILDDDPEDPDTLPLEPCGLCGALGSLVPPELS